MDVEQEVRIVDCDFVLGNLKRKKIWNIKNREEREGEREVTLVLSHNIIRDEKLTLMHVIKKVIIPGFSFQFLVVIFFPFLSYSYS